MTDQARAVAGRLDPAGAPARFADAALSLVPAGDQGDRADEAEDDQVSA